jgi:hypothetical protein
MYQEAVRRQYVRGDESVRELMNGTFRVAAESIIVAVTE